MNPSNQRKHPRVDTNLKVSFRTQDGHSYNALNIQNISLGGVFVHMDPPLGFGAEVSMEFSLKNPKRVIRCTGFVVWSRKESTKEGPPGIGLRLADISIADMRALSEYIDVVLNT